MSGAQALALTGGFAAGYLVGLAYFALLARTVRLFARGSGTATHVALLGARVTLVAVAFLGLAQGGAFAVLAGLAGFVVARLVVQHRARFH